MDMILRIYFIGLVAFVPSESGLEMTVIVERALDGHETSDGHRITPHLPLLLTRGGCTGECRPFQEKVAAFLFESPGQPATRRTMQDLDGALAGGGAWILDDLDLTLELPKSHKPARGVALSPAQLAQPLGPVPPTKETAEAFEWIARMSEIHPEAALIEPDILRPNPRLGLVAARLTLDQGMLRTFTLVDGGSGRPSRLIFRRGAQGPVSPTIAPRAFADWMVVDIPMTPTQCQSGLRIRGRRFGTNAEQQMRFAPPSCEPGVTAEMAIVNLPSWYHAQQSEQRQPSPHGSHFELFYRLAANRLPAEARRIPVLVSSTNTAQPTDQQTNRLQELPELLVKVGLLSAKGVHSQPICIPILFNRVAVVSSDQ